MKEVDQGWYQPWNSDTQSITFTTNSTAWSNGSLALSFWDKSNTGAGNVIINFYEDIRYQLVGCTSLIPFSPDTLPTETLKTWTFTYKYTTFDYPKRVVLYCNGVQVLNQELSDSKCDTKHWWRTWAGMPTEVTFQSVADAAFGNYCISDYTGKYFGGLWGFSKFLSCDS